jgi:hypothetical protein
MLIGSVMLLALLWLQVVHETGHMLAAWLTGGTVQRVVLHPLRISQTEVDPNPQPLAVAWAGPIFGSFTPLFIWGVLVDLRVTLAWLARFFAGSCLIANGLYLGVGSFGAVGDAGDIIRHGNPIWTLWLFGLATAPIGLLLWNGLGPKFGIGPKAEQVSGQLVLVCLSALAGTSGTMLIASP